jgi:hypothetical protein
MPLKCIIIRSQQIFNEQTNTQVNSLGTGVPYMVHGGRPGPPTKLTHPKLISRGGE